MLKFAQFTERGGATISVNVAAITVVRADPDDEHVTTIEFIGGTSVTVSGSYGYVVSQLP